MASEQSARMVAMKAASDNAGNVIASSNWFTTKPVKQRLPKSSRNRRRCGSGLNEFKIIEGTNMANGKIVQCIGAVGGR